MGEMDNVIGELADQSMQDWYVSLDRSPLSGLELDGLVCAVEQVIRGAIVKAATITMPNIQGLDDLAQAFADRKLDRLAGYIRDVALADLAKKMGPGACKIASQYAGWKARTINRMAIVQGLPDDLFDPEIPLGVYWVINQNTDTIEEYADWLRQAQAAQWSIAETKRAMGVEVIRETALDKLKVELDGLRQERQQAVDALRIIALSYRQRIDRQDTLPYEYAQNVLERLGIDLECLPSDMVVDDGHS